MENSLYFKHIKDTAVNNVVIQQLETYISQNLKEQIYVLNAPLGEKYIYSYQNNAIAILSPKHKLIFIDLKGDKKAFDEYYNDFIEDLNSISDKYKYKEYIGRPREWKKSNTIQIYENEFSDFQKLFSETIVSEELQRISELLISLLIGSINEIQRVGARLPETLLERVKKILFYLMANKLDLFIKNSIIKL